MKFTTLFKNFFTRVGQDPRIGPTHISLFMATLYFYEAQQVNPISVFSRDLMHKAKILSSRTYHNCLKDLVELGYLKYIPSSNPFLGSLIWVMA